jgi:hypothetical protein
MADYSSSSSDDSNDPNPKYNHLDAKKLGWGIHYHVAIDGTPCSPDEDSDRHDADNLPPDVWKGGGS